MKIKSKIIKPLPLLHVSFHNQIDMTLSFLRVQEYYESPKFRNRVFELEQYIEWYSNRNSKPRAFDYITQVGGTNVPGNVFRRWQQKTSEQSKFSPKELCLINEVNNYFGENSEHFYLIGTSECMSSDTSYLAHELRHAMFHLIPEYRSDILGELKNFRLRGLRKKLLGNKNDAGYHPSVIDDEIHAYLLTGLSPYYDCKISDLPKEIQLARKALKTVERKFIKKGKIHV